MTLPHTHAHTRLALRTFYFLTTISCYLIKNLAIRLLIFHIACLQRLQFKIGILRRRNIQILVTNILVIIHKISSSVINSIIALTQLDCFNTIKTIMLHHSHDCVHCIFQTGNSILCDFDFLKA